MKGENASCYVRYNFDYANVENLNSITLTVWADSRRPEGGWHYDTVRNAVFIDAPLPDGRLHSTIGADRHSVTPIPTG